MKFDNVEINVADVDYTFQPYDRGANGAFVYREAGVSVHAARVVATTTVNDTASDRLSVQVNQPRTCASETACGPDVVLGTDLVKTEMRFLASTSKADRITQIDKQIALLQEFRGVIEDRAVIYG